jgi:allantoinase
VVLVRSRRVAFPGRIEAASLEIRDGRITAIGPFDRATEGAEAVDAGDKYVLPGLVDTHVHINEPGRTEWEGFRTATRAAAAG